MSLWKTWSSAFKGEICARLGNYTDSVKLLRECLDDFRIKGYFVPLLEFECALARTLHLAGHVEDGLAVVEEGINRAARTDERWCMPELLRIKGEFVLHKCRAEAAEEIFGQSIDLAKAQGAKSWMLRTGMSLTRPRIMQGRAKEGRSSLSAIYHTFDEGFSTSDLMEAKTLIKGNHPV